MKAREISPGHWKVIDDSRFWLVTQHSEDNILIISESGQEIDPMSTLGHQIWRTVEP